MLNKYDYFDKRLLELDRERSVLRCKLWIRVPLDNPIQRGWRRYHILTATAERRADRDVLEEFLKIIGVMRFSRTPEFLKRHGRGRKRRFVEIEQPVGPLTEGMWKKLGWPDLWKLYFRQEKYPDNRSWLDVLVFRSPFLFELKTEPNWVTEIQVINPEVQRRLKEIDSWLTNHDGHHRIQWLHGRSYWWKKTKLARMFDRIAEREIREALQNPPEVDLATPARRSRISPRRFITLTPCSPTRRGTCLRNRSVRVQLLPWGPILEREPDKRAGILC